MTGGLLVSLLPWRHAAPLSTAGRGRAQTTHAGPLLLAATAGLAVLVALGCRFLRRVEVHGASMLPAFEDGDRLLVGPPARLEVGDVVVVKEPGGELLAVKRVAALDEDGAVVVLGDNSAVSRDSRAYGPIERGAVVGRVWWCYHPPERAGWRTRHSSGAVAPSGPPEGGVA